MGRRRLLRSRAGYAVVAAVAGSVLALAAPAEPALAHGVGGQEPTNYKSVVLRIEPSVPGLSIELLDLGDTVELRNDSGAEVTVLGYDGEPYLRVGDTGVYRNERSPATFWNRSTRPAMQLPPGFDAQADPEWARIADDPVVRWHDHDLHWMGSGEPEHPGTEQVVQSWEIPLLRGDIEIAVIGEIRWVPAPPAAPALIAAVALGIAFFLAGRTRRWHAVLVATLLALTAGETLHVVGQWSATTAGVGARLLAAVYSLLGLTFAAFALAGLLRPRSDPYDAVPASLVAVLVLTIAGGLAGLPSLLASQLPTSLPDAAARALVTLSLGAGAGAVALCGAHLRRPG